MIQSIDRVEQVIKMSRNHIKWTVIEGIGPVSLRKEMIWENDYNQTQVLYLKNLFERMRQLTCFSIALELHFQPYPILQQVLHAFSHVLHAFMGTTTFWQNLNF